MELKMMNESMSSILQDDLYNNAKIINELQSLNNKKIVVTGATGLIGSVLCKSVLCANRLYNCNITIYAVVRNMSKAQKIFENVRERKEFNIVKYDVFINKVIYPEKNESIKSDSRKMAEVDYETRKKAYEDAYNKELKYEFDIKDIAGWKDI